MRKAETPFIEKKGEEKKLEPDEEKSLEGLPEFKEMRPGVEGGEPDEKDIEEMTKAQDPSFVKMTLRKEIDKARKKAHEDFFEPKLPLERRE